MYPSGRHWNVVWLRASPGAEVGDGPSMQLGTRAPSPSWRMRPQSARGRVGPRHPRRHGPRVGPAPPKPPLSAAPARASGLRRTAAGLARSDHSRGCSSDSQRLGAAVPRVVVTIASQGGGACSAWTRKAPLKARAPPGRARQRVRQAAEGGKSPSPRKVRSRPAGLSSGARFKPGQHLNRLLSSSPRPRVEALSPRLVFSVVCSYLQRSQTLVWED